MKKQKAMKAKKAKKAKKVTVKKARAGEVVRATKTHAVTSEKVGLLESLIGQLRVSPKGEPGGKPVVEVRSRDEIDRDSGRMTRMEQSFDRRNDHTKKIVTFQDTGEVKFSREGKLSEKNKPK